MNKDFKIGTLDKYIIRKFIGTFLFILIIIITIIIIFDISEKVDNFVQKEAPLKEVVLHYYATMIPYYINLFSPLLVFISVIFFTSKMASNSEIVAILAGGISFNRILYPYFLSAFFIALLSLVLNLFLIPPANEIRLDFTEKYIKDKYSSTGTDFHFQISPDTYVYLEYFNSISNTARKITVETIEGHTIKSKLSASSARWDTLKNTWVLYDYFLRYHDGIRERVKKGATMDTLLPLSVDDFNKRENIVESYNYHELNEVIRTQKMRGDKRVIYALIEKHTRFAVPFSAFILTVMGVALSSRKKRGGIGLNLGIGIALSFVYILFLRFSQMFVHGGIMPPWLALWVPNILFAAVSYFLYRIAPK
ncbi:MAG: LptF/LptG family permease [Bacteroidales bacterium]|nr:LptF/LptG family permease [Bacteroidales bacterium]